MNEYRPYRHENIELGDEIAEVRGFGGNRYKFGKVLKKTKTGQVTVEFPGAFSVSRYTARGTLIGSAGFSVPYLIHVDNARRGLANEAKKKWQDKKVRDTRTALNTITVRIDWTDANARSKLALELRELANKIESE